MTLTISQNRSGRFTVIIRRDPSESEGAAVLFKRAEIVSLEAARALGRAELLRLAPEIRPGDLA
ncbi:MAG: hypothetical protein AAGM38_15885 [Pseudomonadota bacterium]